MLKGNLILTIMKYILIKILINILYINLKFLKIINLNIDLIVI